MMMNTEHLASTGPQRRQFPAFSLVTAPICLAVTPLPQLLL
jgi:hypothetical protein